MSLPYPVIYMVNAVLFIAPVVILSLQLPRRTHYWLRVTLAFLVLFVELSLQFPDAWFHSTLSSMAAMSLYFTLVIVILVLTVLFCNETSIWAASFCAVVGYTVENLGAGTAELVGILIRHLHVIPLLGHEYARTVVCCTLVVAVFAIVVRRGVHLQSLSLNPSKMNVLLVFGAVLINIVFDLAIKYARAFNLPQGFSMLFRIVELAICVYVIVMEFEILYNRQLLLDAATTERMMRDRERQYQLSKENIEAINIKAHDIRHQIRHLHDGKDGIAVGREALADIARQVNIYDSTVKTGNEALDTILTEKSLVGEREQITLSCIVDGKSLGFMSPTDLYALFGNALDNAFEAVRQIDDPELRNISLLVRVTAGMVSIHMENYYAGTVIFEEGMPQTTKKDRLNHGFGTKSMRIIVGRYGGTMTMGTDDETFYLNILIPIPRA